jgi:hypothetical protein
MNITQRNNIAGKAQHEGEQAAFSLPCLRPTSPTISVTPKARDSGSVYPVTFGGNTIANDYTGSHYVENCLLECDAV